MATIAGHTFNSSDICTELTTTVIDGDSVQHICGRRWTDLMHCDETCISQHGYAHTSYLSAAEYSEIKRERERRERAYEAATRGVSGGGDYRPTDESPVQEDTMMCLRYHVHVANQPSIVYSFNSGRFYELSIRSAQTADGRFLDMVAQMFCLYRGYNEPDAEFRHRIISYLLEQINIK